MYFISLSLERRGGWETVGWQGSNDHMDIRRSSEKQGRACVRIWPARPSVVFKYEASSDN
ncbi:hypothetical protein B0H12DRAFT_71686 [Mycena haematopus]|nr:hypothetical protein B0H12DRAFT_71686 [Mycena haematopus]